MLSLQTSETEVKVEKEGILKEAEKQKHNTFLNNVGLHKDYVLQTLQYLHITKETP